MPSSDDKKKKGVGKKLFEALVYKKSEKSEEKSPTPQTRTNPSKIEVTNAVSDADTSALARLARATGRPLDTRTEVSRTTEPVVTIAVEPTPTTTSSTADPEFVQALRQDAQAALAKVADPGYLEGFEQLLMQLEVLRDNLPDVDEASRMRAALKTVERTHSVNVKNILGILRQYQEVLAEKHTTFCDDLDADLSRSAEAIKRETEQLEEQAKSLEAEAAELERQARDKRTTIDEKRRSISADQQNATETKQKIGRAFQTLRDELTAIQQALPSATKSSTK